jgi:HlyD family secretion protein
MKRTYKNILYTAALLSLIAVALYYSEKASESGRLAVKTISPEYLTISDKLIISGNIYPYKEIDVKSPISGILEQYYVKLGDTVKLGDRVAKIKLLIDPMQMDRARISTNLAKIEFQNYEKIYQRDSLLFAKKVIPEAEIEDSRMHYLLKKETYISSLNQLSLLEKGVIPNSDVSNVIKATSSGVIIDLPLQEGSPIIERSNYTEGTSLALIAETDSFLFKSRLIENDILKLALNKSIYIIPFAYDSMYIEARINKISTKGKVHDGIVKYEFEATFHPGDGLAIYSGFNAVAEVVLQRKDSVLAIPEKCLSFRGDSVFVEVLRNKDFVYSNIKVGISDGQHIEVIKGIDKNDRVRFF